MEIPRWKFFLIALLLTLSGCAEEDASTTNGKISTFLADNKLPVGTSFANYDSKHVSISPPAITGDKLFLKLSRESGETLFLGEVDRFLVFNLLVNVLLDEKLLKYEFFSNDASDQALYGEIIL